MTFKKSLSALEKAIKASMDRIAKERDILRKLVDDAASVLESCDEAERELQSAVETLSQYI